LTNIPIMDFKNKVVWITGASSGAGEALVYAFNSEGAKLIISARREAELERVKQNCTNKEAEIQILTLDLEKHSELPKKAESALKAFGKIDIFFSNGGISQRSLIKDTVIDVDKRLMNINYFGSIILAKAILPSLIKQQSGHFAVMSSLTGKFSTPLRSAYAASKHALHGFYDALRSEVFDDNIKVTIICSGYIKTGIAKNALTEDGSAQEKSDEGVENGMAPEYFASQALKAISSQKQELLLGGKERFAVYIKRFAPKLFAKIILKQNVR